MTTTPTFDTIVDETETAVIEAGWHPTTPDRPGQYGTTVTGFARANWQYFRLEADGTYTLVRVGAPIEVGTADPTGSVTGRATFTADRGGAAMFNKFIA